MEEEFIFDLIHETTGCNCIRCAKLYYPYNDPFIVIIDSKTLIKITFKLCLDCLKTFNKCDICDRIFDEPWDNVYTTNLKDMKCECCFEGSKRYKKCYLEKCKNCKKFNKTSIIIIPSRRINCDDIVPKICEK